MTQQAAASNAQHRSLLLGCLFFQNNILGRLGLCVAAHSSPEAWCLQCPFNACFEAHESRTNGQASQVKASRIPGNRSWAKYADQSRQSRQAGREQPEPYDRPITASIWRGANPAPCDTARRLQDVPSPLLHVRPPNALSCTTEHAALLAWKRMPLHDAITPGQSCLPGPCQRRAPGCRACRALKAVRTRTVPPWP